jgi:hypothetical protein
MTALTRTRRPFLLAEATARLAVTPRVLDAWLRDLSEPWTTAHEGGDTWSVFDVIGHLIHGEETDWIPRVKIILEHGDTCVFQPFDRLAPFEHSAGRTLVDRLDAFAAVRERSLQELAALHISASDLDRRGRHPQFGGVTLRQLLATWVAHDLDHISQIARVLAHQYSEEVGPWRAYLRVISGQQG